MDESGRALSQRLFRRRNPEQKRPGPVEILLNTDFLPESQVSILLDGEELNDVGACSALLESLGFGESGEERAVEKGKSVLALTRRAKEPIFSDRQGAHALLPFLDHFVLALSGYGASPHRDSLIERECKLALRVALLVFDSVYVPAVSYVQSALCRRLIDEHRSQSSLGAIRLFSDAPTWGEFMRLRRGEYPRASHARALYSSLDVKARLDELPMHATMIDTTAALHEEWRQHICGESFQTSVLPLHTLKSMSRTECEQLLHWVANDLGSSAFIGSHVKSSLIKQGVQVEESRLSKAICELFFSHFRGHAELDVVEDLTYVINLNVPGAYRPFRYGEMVRFLRTMRPSLLSELENCSAESLWTVKAGWISLKVESEQLREVA